MGFPTGGSCLLQSSFSSSFSCVNFHPQRKQTRRKQPAMASLNPVNQNGSSSFKRRAFLIVGFSAIPLLESRARAAEDLVQDKQDANMIESSQKMETFQEISFLPENMTDNQQEIIQEASESPFSFLLNELGIIGSGVLGALYALAQKEKTAIESTVEAMRTTLSEKEASIAMLEKDYERKLLSEREERLEQIRNAKEEQVSLANQLASANGTVTGLHQELQTEKKLIHDLNAQIDRHQVSIAQAAQDKKVLESKLKEKQDSIDVLQERIKLLVLEVKEKTNSTESLKLALAEKELECGDLAKICNQTKDMLAEANSEAEGLKQQLFKTRDELDVKQSLIDDLNARIEVVVVERDDLNKKIDALQETFDDLKSSSAKQAASDLKLLLEKDKEIEQLKESIKLASNEANKNQASIADLTEERESLRGLLEKEVNNAEKLRTELKMTLEMLGNSSLEAANLSEKLKQSEQSCTNLNTEVSRIKTHFAEVEKSLKTSLDEVTSSSQALSNELASLKNVLKRTEEELLASSEELRSAMLVRENLKKELLEIYKKAESTYHDLKEERKSVIALNRDLEASRRQVLEEREARQALENDLEEAMLSLSEMNRNAISLSRELEVSNSRAQGFEAEKDLLYKSLIEQKNVAREAQENAEDAHEIITSLGKERDSLAKRAKRLEGEMASAKGEILRLRRQMNSMRSPAEGEHQVKGTETERVVPSAKKTSRKKKGEPTVEVSQ